MDLSVVFLGTGGSVPTARRATASVLVRAGGRRIMVDCGEGTQRQMVRSIGLIPVDEIYLTHFHADHYLGLPGLLKTWDLHGRQRPLRVLGPKGLKDLFKALRRIFGKLAYELELAELGPGDAVEHDGFDMRSFPVQHRMEAYGYALVEQERPGRFDPEEARRLGIADERDFGRLQRGETVEGSSGPVSPGQVMGEPRQGRKVAITGDTAPAESTAAISQGAQLLVHDGAFASDEGARAAETGHSTAVEAAKLARDAGVAMLAIVHVSSRHNVGSVLDEAREVHPNAFAPRDFDLVEIPYPERGAPELIEGGARQRRDPEAMPLVEGVPGDEQHAPAEAT